MLCRNISIVMELRQEGERERHTWEQGNEQKANGKKVENERLKRLDRGGRINKGVVCFVSY